MSYNSHDWPELSRVYEDLLCGAIGLSKPLNQHGKLLNSLNTLVSALSPSTKNKGEVERYPSKTKPIIVQLDWAPLSWGADSRNRVLINPDHVTLLWNGIMLQGVFGEPKLVVELMLPKADRKPFVEWAKQLFLDRQSLAGLGLLRQELISFLEKLPDVDLQKERLPNPFADTLPQMGLGHLNGNVLKALATQTAALSLGDSMMTHYLAGNLEKAYEAATQVQTDNALLLRYRELILREYQRAKEFDDLLDSFR